MKAEINNENKARFYGANWGNTVVIDGNRLNLNSIDDYGWLEDSYLELKSLSDISDEDAIDVAKIGYWRHKESDEILVKRMKNVVNQKFIQVEFLKHGMVNALIQIYYFNPNGEIHFQYKPSLVGPFVFQPLKGIMYITDFLRSRGYLLGWGGLTEDEIIEAGWAKYKE